MPRGRKPVPQHLRLLRGNPGGHVLRPQPNPERDSTIPDPPAILNQVARQEWLRIATEAYRIGVLTLVDSPALTAYCQLYGHWINAELAFAEAVKADPANYGLVAVSDSNGVKRVNPLFTSALNAARDMMRYATEFGFTPSSRSRIAARPEQKGGKYEGLVRKTGS